MLREIISFSMNALQSTTIIIQHTVLETHWSVLCRSCGLILHTGTAQWAAGSDTRLCSGWALCFGSSAGTQKRAWAYKSPCRDGYIENCPLTASKKYVHWRPHLLSWSRVKSVSSSFSRPARTPRAFFSRARCSGPEKPALNMNSRWLKMVWMFCSCQESQLTTN